MAIKHDIDKYQLSMGFVAPASVKKLIGGKFGRLYMSSYIGGKETPCGAILYYLKGKCDCGSVHFYNAAAIRSGKTASCGCLQAELTSKRVRRHGHKSGGKSTRAYRAWRGIISRCFYPTDINWKRYGAKGITVHPEWRHSFELFLEHIGPPPTEKHTIDRYPDKNGNYVPGNVRWATQMEQMNNVNKNRWVTFNGKLLTISQLAREVGIAARTLHYRIIKRGATVDAAVSISKKAPRNFFSKMGI